MGREEQFWALQREAFDIVERMRMTCLAMERVMLWVSMELQALQAELLGGEPIGDCRSYMLCQAISHGELLLEYP